MAVNDFGGGHYPLPPGAVSTAIHAGNATLTVQSALTGKHFTFRVKAKSAKNQPKAKKAETGPLYFVRVLGSDQQYHYIGCFKKGWTSLKSTSKGPAPSRQAFDWVLRRLARHGAEDPFEGQAVFFTSGRCCRCGRELTEPESIQTGLGPICREKV